MVRGKWLPDQITGETLIMRSFVPTKLTQDLPVEFRRYGFWRAAYWLWQYFKSIPYERVDFDIFVRSLDDPLPLAQPRLPITTRLATKADLPYFQNLVLPSEYQHFARRLAHSRHCFLTFAQEEPEKPIAYRWAATEIDPDVDDLILNLPAEYAYIDDAYTLPAYRRLGIQIAMYSFWGPYLQTLGCNHIIAIVEVKNRPSQLEKQRLNYQKVGQTTFLRVFRTIISPLEVVLPEKYQT